MASSDSLTRRTFITLTALAPVAARAARQEPPLPGTPLEISEILGGLRKVEGEPLLDGATWYEAASPEDGFLIRFPAGQLAGARYLASDMYVDGDTTVVFTMLLQEGDNGRRFRLTFAELNRCSFRMRMALSLVDQNRWQADREGAFLKPLCGGDRVDLAKVDRLSFAVLRKAGTPARWCMTPLVAAPAEVPKIGAPVLPKGKLIDELGQSAQREWPGRTRSIDEMKRRIQAQYDAATGLEFPEEFTRWGGWKAKKLTEGAGFFRTHNDGRRWWLVDPDGYAFWSAGLDCVRVDCESRCDGIESALAWMPDPKGEFAGIYQIVEGDQRPGSRFINYLAANLIRTFGPKGWHDKWATVALSQLKRLRFNTVGNWSEWEYAAKARFPYVRPMSFEGKRSPMVYRDFPDVFHSGFEADAADYANALRDTAKDSAFIGYFLMNEPTWAFSTELPAAGMLFNTGSCATRDELARFLKKKHPDDAALANAWKLPVTFDKVSRGKWSGVLTPEALEDLRAFSILMVERYFQTISRACKRVDPNHLNLGMRWAGVPPEWAVEGMKVFDVFSLNCYMDRLPLEQAEKIHSMLKMPVMVGEWHFGALDVGLPASGIGHLKNQAERAKAYRVYLEDAAADPYCVGAHWFTLYDESALGRFDGENWNIGFLDICHRPYAELCDGAIASHERMYQVAEAKVKAFDEVPEYLPKLFL